MVCMHLIQRGGISDRIVLCIHGRYIKDAHVHMMCQYHITVLRWASATTKAANSCAMACSPYVTEARITLNHEFKKYRCVEPQI